MPLSGELQVECVCDSYKLDCFYWARFLVSERSNNSLIELQRIKIWNLAGGLNFAEPECLVPSRMLHWDV